MCGGSRKAFANKGAHRLSLNDFLKTFVKNLNWFIKSYSRISSIWNWELRHWSAPAPSVVKQSILLSRPSQVWIETGTYFGETTKILAKYSSHVTSIEADPELHTKAKVKFVGSNIDLRCGSSSDLIGDAIKRYIENNFLEINFYLDAHYSGPGTFFSTDETAIVKELEVIGSFLKSLKSCNILIDDFRIFSDSLQSRDNKTSKYPRKSFLVEFADQHNLNWTVHHDIFVMSKVN